MTDKPKRGPGRPVEKPLPAPIDDSPENVMRAILSTPPKREDEWKYLKEGAAPPIRGRGAGRPG